MEICGPIGNSPGCSVCERCKAETLIAEASFREMRLKDEKQRLIKWLEVIESHPTSLAPNPYIAIESMKKMARNALDEISEKAENPENPETTGWR